MPRFAEPRPAGQGRWIGVVNGTRRPLPPNPVSGFPATGSSVRNDQLDRQMLDATNDKTLMDLRTD
jgi:hypothetical protein